MSGAPRADRGELPPGARSGARLGAARDTPVRIRPGFLGARYFRAIGQREPSLRLRAPGRFRPIAEPFPARLTVSWKRTRASSITCGPALRGTSTRCASPPRSPRSCGYRWGRSSPCSPGMPSATSPRPGACGGIPASRDRRERSSSRGGRQETFLTASASAGPSNQFV